jgi:hypothetical protein
MRLQSTSGTTGLLLARQRTDVDLIGDKNGVNSTFTTPDYFIQTSTVKIQVFRNGVRLRLGLINDYTVSESGGVGTGYDTVIYNGPPPLSFEQLTSDYIVAS